MGSLKSRSLIILLYPNIGLLSNPLFLFSRQAKPRSHANLLQF